MTQKKMYPGMVNSPVTTITNNISATDTIIYVLDDTKIPEPPNLLVLGGALQSAETVLLTAKDGNMLTVQRGLQGTAIAWNAGATIARNFTEYDYRMLKENIEDLALSAGDITTLATDDKTNLVAAVNEVKAQNNSFATKLKIPTLTVDPINAEIGMIWLLINEYPTAPTISLLETTDSTATILLDVASTDQEDGTITTYRLFINDVDQGVDLSLIAGNTYVISGLTNGQTYNIYIKGKDSVGQLGVKSNTIQATPFVALVKYNMDEASGDVVADGSGNGYNATAYNTAIVAGLNGGNARKGNGSSAYIRDTTGIPLAGKSSLFISCFFTRDAVQTGYQQLISYYRNSAGTGVGFYFAYHDEAPTGITGRLITTTGDTSFLSTGFHPILGQKYKLTIEWVNGIITLTIYSVAVDGKLTQVASISKAVTGEIRTGINALTLLAANSAVASEFGPFTIDDLLIS